jgi:hypothetical protein
MILLQKIILGRSTSLPHFPFSPMTNYFVFPHFKDLFLSAKIGGNSKASKCKLKRNISKWKNVKLGFGCLL